MFRNGARVHLARSDETGIIESWNEETQEYTVLVESANEPSSPWGEEEHNDHPADKHVRATASFLTAPHSSLSIDWAVDIANDAAHSLQSHNEQFVIAGYTAKLDALHTEVQLEDEIVERLKQRIDLIEKAQGCRSYPVTNIENELGPVEYENLLILGERAMSAYSCDTYTRAMRMPTRTATRTARRNRPEHHKRPYLATVCGRDRLVQHLVPHRATTSHLV